MTCVAIAGCKITLRCSTIMIATPGGDEGGKMTVIRVEEDTVVSVPGVKYGLLSAMGDGPCLMEGGLGVVGLSGCMEVECLEVHCSARFSILLRANYHSMTLCDRFANWDRFDYTKADNLVRPGLDLLSPVKWDRQGPLGQPSIAWVDCPSWGGVGAGTVKGAGLVVAVVLAHVVKGHPCHHNVLLPDGKSFYCLQDLLL